VIVAPLSPQTAPASGFFDEGQPGSYLVWYGAEYAAVALAGGLYASGVAKDIAPLPAAFGPRFDLARPDLPLLFDPRLDDVIGRPMLREKIPDEALVGAAAVVLVGTTAVDWLAGADAHRTHALVLGGLESVLGTVVVTEVMKLSFGRLRPDFRERWLRAACAGNVSAPRDLDCSGVDDSVSVSRRAVYDGMKSFPSGHSSTAFALLTFSTLAIGSRWIVNDDAPAWAQPVAGLAVGALAAGAGFTAASRLADHRHHPEDVVVGALIGSTVAASTWLVHFDTHGQARTRWPVQVVPSTSMGATGTGSGVALAGSF
jgi:membrane-associated phospholipid phosphatase